MVLPRYGDECLWGEAVMKIGDIELVEEVTIPTEKCYWEKWQCTACDKIYPCQVTITANFNDSREVIFNRKCAEHGDRSADWGLIGSSVHKADSENSDQTGDPK